MNCGNPPYDNCSDYYKLSITIPLLDHVIANLNSYFSNNHLIAANGFHLVPYMYIKANNESVNWREKLRSLFQFYIWFFFGKTYTSRKILDKRF